MFFFTLILTQIPHTYVFIQMASKLALILKLFQTQLTNKSSIVIVVSPLKI